ncbi:MAG: PAS domain S-box protein [Bacteroidales bacterium]|nr:PAS domain S-box protein [Bacteroidales bacterium]
MNLRHIVHQEIISKRQFVLYSFFAGLFFLLLTWALESGRQGLGFNLSSIRFIHLQNPLLIVIVLLPVSLAVLSWIFYNYLESRQKLINELKQKLIITEQNTHDIALFAGHITNGNYDVEFDVADESDNLAYTLLNLRDKLKQNNEKESLQNWEMTGKDKISQILRMHTDLNDLSYEVLEALIRYMGILQGIFYIYDEDVSRLRISATFAYNRRKFLQAEISIGEGLVGQAAIERDIIYRTEIPENYVSISSGLIGDKKPHSLLIVPMFMEEKLQGAFEFASVKEFKTHEIAFIKSIAEIVARTVFNLKITEKTEKLLYEAQTMTEELRQNEEQLRQNAEEMIVTQEELEKANAHLEEKIQEVNQSQKRLYSLLENASELIFIYDQNKKLKYVSPSSRNILGYSEEEMFEEKDMGQISENGKSIIDQMFDDLLRFPGKSQTIQYSFRHKNGSTIFLETTGRNLLYDNAINGLILNTSDITERKRAEKEQRMRGQMQTLSDNSPDIILRIDTQKNLFYANPALEAYTGIKAEEILKKQITKTELPSDLTGAINKIADKVCKTRKKIHQEITFMATSDKKIMSLNAIPECGEDNHLETILFILHDISELKEIQEEIKHKNAKITDSINYAFRLQNAIMPSQRLMKECFPDSFMYYLPRDIVSGDFPWLYKKDEFIYIAAVDCTGHGVPGAMLSLIGYFTLNQIVSRTDNLSPDEILHEMHEGVKQTLRQNMEGASARDGMDIALCKIDTKNRKLEFSGAHRPLYHVHDGALYEYKGTRSAIGGISMPGKPEPDFKNYSIDISENDLIYLFSDGLPDQFGGPHGTKYLPKRIKEIVVENNALPMHKIYDIFNNDFKKWLGKGNQIDDVLLIGIRL